MQNQVNKAVKNGKKSFDTEIPGKLLVSILYFKKNSGACCGKKERPCQSKEEMRNATSQLGRGGGQCLNTTSASTPG